MTALPRLVQPRPTEVDARAAFQIASVRPKHARYRVLAQHLHAADEMLTSLEGLTQRRGLGVALEAARSALYGLGDSALAIDICDGYVVPNLDHADPVHWQWMSRETVLENGLVPIYAAAGSEDRVAEACRQLISIAHNRNTLDATRLTLAMSFERQGRFREAVDELKKIDPTGSMSGARKNIARIEAKIAKQGRRS